MDETELVIKMQRGDADAFSLLFEKYQSKLFRTAYLISGSSADSEDIVQETFVTCYVNRKQLKEPACFPKWLYQILTRTAWKFCRERGKEQPVEELFDENQSDGSLNVLEEVIRREEKAILFRTIQRLEIKQRTVVVLYYYNQLSTREIAGVLGCMEGTVKSRLHTARSNLSKALGNMA